MFKGRVWLLSFDCAPVWRALPCSHGAPTKTSSTLNKKWAKPGVFHYSSHTGTPDSTALRGERYEISIGIILGWVLMSISSAIFNGPAASPLTPTRHFKGALLSIPQSCIKHVNLGDMLTTRPHVLPNSNEDSDHLGRERRRFKPWPRLADLSIFPPDPSLEFFELLRQGKLWTSSGVTLARPSLRAVTDVSK